MIACCSNCERTFDSDLTYEGELRTAAPRRKYCTRACGNRGEHLRNGRERNLRRLYGISERDYLAMVEAQDRRCATCGLTPEDSPGGRSRDGRLYVDHDHETGTNRGLLCSRCNVLLGMATESVDVLLSAIDYLEQHHDELG